MLFGCKFHSLVCHFELLCTYATIMLLLSSIILFLHLCYLLYNLDNHENTFIRSIAASMSFSTNLILLSTEQQTRSYFSIPLSENHDIKFEI